MTPKNNDSLSPSIAAPLAWLSALCLLMLSATYLCGFGSNDRLRVIDVFSVTGNAGSTLSYAISPPVAGGRHRVQYINATSDLSSADLIFGNVAAPVVVTATSASGQGVINAPGTGFSNADVVIAYSLANNTIERLVVSSSAAGTITTGNLTYPLATGDRVYKVTDGPAIRVGAATKELNAPGGQVFVNTANRPLYVRLPGTSACRIANAAGELIAP